MEKLIRSLLIISCSALIMNAMECTDCHTPDKNNLDSIKNWKEIFRNNHQKLKDAHKSDDLKDVMEYLNSKEFEKKAPQLKFRFDNPENERF